MTELSLIVIRTSNLVRSRAFYAALGLEIEKQQHSGGPMHYGANVGNTYFEIYPKGISRETTGVRLGFEVSSLEDVLNNIDPTLEVKRLREGHVVVTDPDGHRVELTQVYKVSSTV